MPGHQNSGASTYFFRVFSSLHAHSCWPCSDKTRFCVEHINTNAKQQKIKVLKPILEIKTKNLLVSLEGHQTSGARAPELWCPLPWSTWKGTRLLVPGHHNSGAPNNMLTVFLPKSHFWILFANKLDMAPNPTLLPNFAATRWRCSSLWKPLLMFWLIPCYDKSSTHFLVTYCHNIWIV